MLCVAAKEIEAGLVDARLGGFLLKKRVARPGQGKRRSYRTILAHRQGDKLFFLHGFGKNEKQNISPKEKKALLALGDLYMGFDNPKLAKLVKKKLILEVTCHEQNPQERP